MLAIRVAASHDDMLKAFAVRMIVFCGEQKIAYAIEHDAHDATAVHLLGEDDGEPVASGRLRFLEDYAKLERIAVRAPWRGRGYGGQMTAFMLATARARGCRTFVLHAQAPVAGFYARHGFQIRGDQFMEADIPHFLMTRDEISDVL